MLVFRYLAKEVFVTLIALTVILMFILISNQLVGYLGRAASGRIPGLLVFQLLALEMPNLLSLLLPMGFYMSIMLAFGRLYSENEMLVLHACGLSIRRLLAYTLTMALIVSVLVAVMVLLNPNIAGERARLLQTSGLKAFIQMLAPQQFQALPQSQVLYIDEVNRSHTRAGGLFLAKMNPDANQSWQWQIIAAHEMSLKTSPNAQDELVMTHGRVYRLSPGTLKAQYGTFEEAVLKIPEVESNENDDLRAASLSTIWTSRHQNPMMRAELQWRISIVLMSLVLTMVAVPLSHVQSRHGKFAKIFPAIIIFLMYVAMLFLWRDKVLYDGWKGGNMLIVHVVFLLLGLFLFWRQKRRLG